MGDAFDDGILLGPVGDADEVPITTNSKEGAETSEEFHENSPFQAWMLQPLVHDAIAQTPNMCSSTMRALLKDCVIGKFLTSNLVQNTRCNMRDIVLGHPDVNIQYLPVPALAWLLDEG